MKKFSLEKNSREGLYFRINKCTWYEQKVIEHNKNETRINEYPKIFNEIRLILIND